MCLVMKRNKAKKLRRKLKCWVVRKCISKENHADIIQSPFFRECEWKVGVKYKNNTKPYIESYLSSHAKKYTYAVFSGYFHVFKKKKDAINCGELLRFYFQYYNEFKVFSAKAERDTLYFKGTFEGVPAYALRSLELIKEIKTIY